MQAEKTVGMSFRITPEMKRLLVAAAARENRSLTNMLEFLVRDYCRIHRLCGESFTEQGETIK